MTLNCACGTSMSYKYDETDDDKSINDLFRKHHTGEGHQITEQPGVYFADKEERHERFGVVGS